MNSSTVTEDSRGDGFGGHVELGIIGVAVKMESMVADDLTEGKHVDQWFSNFLHQVPPQKIFGSLSTTIMTNMKIQ